MKCKNCGADIAEGKLYCETCGNEIQIVPEYEPEVEQTIHQTMDHIVNAVFEKDRNASKNKNAKDISAHKKHSEKVNLESEDDDQHEGSWFGLLNQKEKHYYRWIVLILTVSVIVLLSVWGYMSFTADYQIRRGNYYLKIQDYEQAMKYYERAGSLAPENPQAALYLAVCFEALDRMPGYEACLTKVIQSDEATTMQLELAYTRLATLYLDMEEYQKIDSLLKKCKIDTVLKIFGKYCAQIPVFSHESGEYTAIVPLKIQSVEKGCVYYTVDGSDPTADSPTYSGPIFLNKGEHTIKAIFVNEFGVASEVVTGKFIISD